MQDKIEDLRQVILRQRWSHEILEQPCLDEVLGVNRVINKVKKQLNLDFKEYSQFSDEDLELCLEFYSYLHYCQSQVVEAAQLSIFFEDLLTNHNLGTLVASTMNNLQPRVGDNLTDLTAMNMWFERLDKMYNFSLGPVILPLLKTDNLTQLAKLDPPYLKDFKTSIDDNQLGNITKFFGKTFNMLYDKYALLEV